MCPVHFDGWIGFLGTIIVAVCAPNVVGFFPPASPAPSGTSVLGHASVPSVGSGHRWLDLE